MTNDELDGVLDGALARYSSVEPMAGIEQRVLNRVRAAGSTPRLARFGFGRWALAVAAVAVGVAITTAVRWDRPPGLSASGAGQAGRPVLLAVPKQATPASITKRHGQARRPVLPLSGEERALMKMVASAPEALLDLELRSTQPIQIEEIKIEPLRSDYDDAK
jgi:hypothetical protein